MNQILLQPTDVLFFRDGRPMGGSLSGNGAAWPLPTVTAAALRAALWRSGLAAEAHPHARVEKSQRSDKIERFGSLSSAGPFPVRMDGGAETWFFPRPLDARLSGTESAEIELTHAPTPQSHGAISSNPLPLLPARLVRAAKQSPDPWWNLSAWDRYVDASRDRTAFGVPEAVDHAAFSDSEATIGIGISPETGAQDQQSFYSARYLRLREAWRLGLFAETTEKVEIRGDRRDLIAALLDDSSQLLVGGQQRVCTASRVPFPSGARLPLPIGQLDDFPRAQIPELEDQPKRLLKWSLLSPAIFPRIQGTATGAGEPILPHNGGWLPSWIRDDSSFAVQLRAPLPPRDPANESRADYRARVRAQPPIAARLVAALVDKPIPVTGWSLGTPDAESVLGQHRSRAPGAKPTHLAVPAGSVYYFACDGAEAAKQLAAALNWHGDDPAGSAIRNRRSTLLGEKGFGLGVCSGWTPHGSG